MWFLFWVMLLVGGVMHARLGSDKSPGRLAELCLVYLLVGYCGVGTMLLGIAALVHGAQLAAHLGVPAGNPIQVWTGFAIVGMSATAILGAWLRGNYLIGPVVTWAIFFAGATYAHLHADAVRGHETSAMSAAWIFATHALISVLLVTLLLMSRAAGRRG